MISYGASFNKDRFYSVDTVTDMYSQTVRLIGFYQTDLLLGPYEGPGDAGSSYRRVHA